MGKYFGKMLTDRIDELGITKYRLHKLSGVAESSVIRIANGNKRPTDDIIKRFSGVTELGICEETLLQWRMADDYPEQTTRAQMAPEIQIPEGTPKMEAFHAFFDGLTPQEQIEFIKSKFHLFDEVKKIDAEKNKK